MFFEGSHHSVNDFGYKVIGEILFILIYTYNIIIYYFKRHLTCDIKGVRVRVRTMNTRLLIGEGQFNFYSKSNDKYV